MCRGAGLLLLLLKSLACRAISSQRKLSSFVCSSTVIDMKLCLQSDCYLLLSFYDTFNSKDYIFLYSYNNVDSNSGHSDLNCRMISEE